jgi:hypothetical protein
MPGYSLPPSQNLKITDFVDMMIPNVLHDLPSAGISCSNWPMTLEF